MIADLEVLEWAKYTILNQSTTLLSKFLFDKALRIAPISTTNDVTIDVNASESEERMDITMFQRLQHSLGRTFQDRLSSCVILTGCDQNSWWPFLLAACTDTNHRSLLHRAGRSSFLPELGGIFAFADTIGDDLRSEVTKNEPKNDLSIACINGEWIDSDTEALASISYQLRTGTPTVDVGRAESNNLVLENIIDHLKQRRIDQLPAIIVLYNFHLFAMENAHAATSFIAKDFAEGGSGSGARSKNKQLLIYTLLDLMHRKDLYFLLIGVTNIADVQTLLEKRVLSRLNAQFVQLPILLDEKLVRSYVRSVCTLPVLPIEFAQENNVRFVRKFNLKVRMLFRDNGSETDTLIGDAISTHLQWGCDMDFFRRVLVTLAVDLSEENLFPTLDNYMRAFSSMEPPYVQDILASLPQLQLLVFSSAVRLGTAGRGDYDLAGYFSLHDLMNEVSKLGSWAASNSNISTPYQEQPLPQFYLLEAVQALIHAGLLSATEGNAAKGFRSQQSNSLTCLLDAENEGTFKSEESLRFAGGRLQNINSSNGALLQLGPQSLLFLSHSPAQLREAYSLKSNKNDGLLGKRRHSSLTMSTKIRNAVLQPMLQLNSQDEQLAILENAAMQSRADGDNNSNLNKIRFATVLEKVAL